MAKGWFGVDFASDDMSLLDQAIAAFGKVAFVGQYRPVFPTSRARVDFIHSRGAAVLPIWNADQRGLRCGGSYEMGVADGQEAADDWASIGHPEGCLIAFDFENSFEVSGEYLRGVLDGVASRKRVGAAYLNPPNGLNHAAAWQYARAHGARGVVFTSQNQPFSLANFALREFVIGAEGGNRYPVPGWEGDTVVGQYSIPPQSSIVPVDLDCASDAGLALMWGAASPPPPPPAPKAWHVTQLCSLKVDHSHTDQRLAKDPAGQPVRPDPGTDVQPTGTTWTDPATKEVWWEVRLTRNEAVVHGWVPKSVIAEGP